MVEADCLFVVFLACSVALTDHLVIIVLGSRVQSAIVLRSLMQALVELSQRSCSLIRLTRFSDLISDLTRLHIGTDLYDVNI